MLMNPKTQIITWSRYRRSLLYSFRYMAGKENEIGNFDVFFEGKKVANINKKLIALFLIQRGHNIALGEGMNKPRMHFNSCDKPLRYYESQKYKNRSKE